MPGFSNDIVYADNVDFSGNTVRTPQVLLDGQLLIGSSVAPNIQVNTITAGIGINVTNGHGTITITNTGASNVWSRPTAALNPVTLVISHSYVPIGGAPVNFVLPATANVGEGFQIVGYGNLWTISQNAFQTINMGNKNSTVGVLGGISATVVRDSVTIVCVTQDTEFQITSAVGNILFF